MENQVTARVSDELKEQIEAFSNEINATKAEAVRTLLKRGLDFNEIKRENERLRDQLAATNQRIDDTKEIVEYVEEERKLQQQRHQKENAPVWKRAKYWVFGFPEEK